MSRTITGPLETPDGTNITDGSLLIRALRHNYSADGTTPIYSELTQSLAAGTFSFDLNLGDYEVLHQPAAGGKQRLGVIAVEAGGSITLGELIELSRDASADYSISSDWATKAWVAAYHLGGGSPGDIPITSLGVGTGTTLQSVRINAAGTGVEGFTLNLGTIAISPLTASQFARVNAGGTALEGYTMPLAKTVADNYEAADEDILILPAGKPIKFSATPTVGDEIIVLPSESWTSSNPTIDPQGVKFRGQTGTLSLDLTALWRFTYTGATYGWSF